MNKMSLQKHRQMDSQYGNTTDKGRVRRIVLLFCFLVTLIWLQIWNTQTIERLRHVAVKPVGNTEDPLFGSFFQGISTLTVQHKVDHICIGSSTGSIHVFQCSPVFQFSEVCYVMITATRLISLILLLSPLT
jgi:hypothetical protein